MSDILHSILWTKPPYGNPASARTARVPKYNRHTISYVKKGTYNIVYDMNLRCCMYYMYFWTYNIVYDIYSLWDTI